MLAAAAELAETYRPLLLDMEDPQTYLYYGDYSFDGSRRFQIGVYDGSGNRLDQLLSYCFDRVLFYLDVEDRGVSMVRIFRPDRSLLVGEYPILTVEEARARLAEGYYLTSVPEPLPGLDQVAKAELCYRTGELEEYFLPYYRFYVELPEYQLENGLKTYGAYYVPAVRPEYLSEVTVWDGSFN